MSLTILPIRISDGSLNSAGKSPSSTAFQGAHRAFQSRRNGSDGMSIEGPGQQRISLQRSTLLSSTSIAKPDMEGGPLHRKPSPSHTAALLAHHRAMSSQDIRITANKDVKGLLRPTSGTRPDAGSGIPKGDSSYALPSTQALVKLYEAKTDTPTRTQSVRYVSRPQTPLRSPVPIRPPTAFNAPPDPAPRKTPNVNIEAKAPLGARLGAAAAAANLVNASVTKSDSKKRHAPEPPLPRGSLTARLKNQPRGAQIIPEKTDSAFDGTVHETAGTKNSDGAKVASITSTASMLAPSTSNPSISSLSRQTTNRSSKTPPLRPSVRVSRSFDKSERPVLLSRSSRDSQQALSQQMSVDSLANAIVASSLASSRAASPSKPPPPPTAPHNHRFQLFHRNHSHEQISRTPSPAKAMRQTMRDQSSLEESHNRHKNKSSHHHHLVRKHPNKHHEGDRKRYRTQLTERERRRYEGVWAANRGLLVPEESNAVMNVVVRDIWRRSRLPDDVLEEVWDLVSVRELDRLGRDEFVVGLWLIDQRLKGNKLPVKVSESVWGSVRRLEGIKIPKQKH